MQADPDYPRATCATIINNNVNMYSIGDVNRAVWDPSAQSNALDRLVDRDQFHFNPSAQFHASYSLTENGYSPLHLAVSSSNAETASAILDTHSRIDSCNVRDKDGNTPLMWLVATDGSEEIMETLVDHGADVNAQNYVGETALFLACGRGLVDKVEFLLENGARTQIANLDGATPLHVACAGGYSDVVTMLVQYGAFLNAGDDEDDTPLHWAVREGHTEIIKQLISNGAEGNCANSDGETPLGLAVSLESQEVVQCLLGMGIRDPAVTMNTDAMSSKLGVGGFQYADVDVMNVEMKGLSIEGTRIGAKTTQKGFGDDVPPAVRFGGTPPSLSFVF